MPQESAAICNKTLLVEPQKRADFAASSQNITNLIYLSISKLTLYHSLLQHTCKALLTYACSMVTTDFSARMAFVSCDSHNNIIMSWESGRKSPPNAKQLYDVANSIDSLTDRESSARLREFGRQSSLTTTTCTTFQNTMQDFERESSRCEAYVRIRSAKFLSDLDRVAKNSSKRTKMAGLHLRHGSLGKRSLSLCIHGLMVLTCKLNSIFTTT